MKATVVVVDKAIYNRNQHFNHELVYRSIKECQYNRLDRLQHRLLVHKALHRQLVLVVEPVLLALRDGDC